ncbi:transferase [Flavobacterium sp. AJR]|nr:transferase [Flavobacterium sp. AJR]
MVRTFYHDMKRYAKVNWVKTIYFNFKKFPFKTAKKLPVFFYGKVSFQSIKGEIIIQSPIKKGMIGFGKRFEKFSRSKGIAEICLEGKLIFKGYAMFGQDYLIYIAEYACLEVGNFSGMGSDCKIACSQYIKLGNNVRISYESQILDSNFHQMIDTQSGERIPLASPIIIGNNNFIGNRTTIMPKTITPDFCTISSNSLSNRDYTLLGTNILIGGVPAKLIKTNISRDWDSEKDNLDIWYKV